MHDPSPDAERVVREVLANAERATARLVSAPLPASGTSVRGKIEAAVAGADFVQESVPERLELKRGCSVPSTQRAPPDALIGSSTSGLLPSDLQAEMAHPERLVVAHPFNPVYLLPLVELVAGARDLGRGGAAGGGALRGARHEAGGDPARDRAFVGDRLLEALWREALWLVNDDVATVEEIDDVIRYPSDCAGRRWAFQTYRIAGGEAGMRHFLAQFGPALKWPWTKLMDVPDLDDALVEKIAAQSDAQAAGSACATSSGSATTTSWRCCGRWRRSGAAPDGAPARYLRQARGRAPRRAAVADAAPLRLREGGVPEAWIDYNGHMTESRYLQVFGDTTDALLALSARGPTTWRRRHGYTPSRPTSATWRDEGRRGVPTPRRRSSGATRSGPASAHRPTAAMAAAPRHGGADPAGPRRDDGRAAWHRAGRECSTRSRRSRRQPGCRKDQWRPGAGSRR